MTAPTVSLAAACGSGDRGLPGVSRVRAGRQYVVVSDRCAFSLNSAENSPNVAGARDYDREPWSAFCAPGTPVNAGRRKCG